MSPPTSHATGRKLQGTWAALRTRSKRAMRPPRRITFTRAGKFFMVLTLAVGAGALNTGNNLLFLLLGMTLSGIIASGVLSEAVLRKLEVSRAAPRRLFAGRPAPAHFKLTNPRGYLSINVEVSECEVTCVRGPLAGQSFGHRDVSAFKFWVPDDFSDDGHVAIGRAAQVPAHTTCELTARYLFPARGHYTSPGLRLATRFPFGIFHKVAEVDRERTWLVFPAPAPAKDWAADVAARFGDIARDRAGGGQEYFGLRDWRVGEDRRRIHWRSSARRDAFVVREMEEQEQRALELVLVHASGSESPPSQATRDAFEQGLSRVVGLLQELTSEHYRVALRTLESAGSPGEGAGHLDGMLEQLAVLQLREGAPGALPATQVRAEGRSGRDVARVGVGFSAALAQCAEDFDLSLSLDPTRDP